MTSRVEERLTEKISKQKGSLLIVGFKTNAARLICCSAWSDYIPLIHHALHWLPVQSCVKYKNLLTFKSLSNQALSCFSDLIQLYALPYQLLILFADARLLRLPSAHLKSNGQHTFYWAPLLWNKLHYSLWHSSFIASVNSALKIHLFTSKHRIDHSMLCACVCVCVRCCVHTCMWMHTCLCVCMCVLEVNRKTISFLTFQYLFKYNQQDFTVLLAPYIFLWTLLFLYCVLWTQVSWKHFLHTLLHYKNNSNAK